MSDNNASSLPEHRRALRAKSLDELKALVKDADLEAALPTNMELRKPQYIRVLMQKKRDEVASKE